MAEFTHAINAFNGGEISPHLFGRTDIQKYSRAAAGILNFLVKSEGGLVRRSGTRFIKTLKDQTATAHLIPFIFSTEQAYVIEMGASYFRFYRDEGAVLETGQVITGVSKTNPASVTVASHTFATGDEVYITGIVGMTELNGRFFTITDTGTNTFTLDNEDSSAYTAWSSAGTAAKVHEVPHTYAQSELADVKFVQSADVLYLAHQMHAPAKLSRTGHTSWTLADIAFTDGPYIPENVTKTTLTSSGTAGTVTVTASSVNGINDGAGFIASDVGRPMRIDRSITNAGGWGVITVIGSTTSVTVEIEKGGWPTAPRTTWRLGSWWVDNYPAAVSFAEGRLWWGGEPEDPQTFHGSKSAQFESHEPKDDDDSTITDAHAITYTVGANQVNEIKWMEVGRNLILGTPGSVLAVQASSNNEPVTPTNINVPVGSSIGAHGPSAPVRVGNFVLYVDRSQRRLRGLRYSLDSDAYVAEDLTRIARHITESGINHIAYQLEPDSQVWCVRTDGIVATLTFIPEEEVFAWARHQVGGSFGSGNAVVEDLIVIPAPNGQRDQVYMIVKRTINGATTRYVEFIEAEFDDESAIEDAFFVDSGLSYSGTPQSTLQGLNHLEGETVQILADGANKGTAVVASGSVTLPGGMTASDIHIGLAFNSDLDTLRLDSAPARPGTQTTQGILKRIAAVIPRFHRTNSGKYGKDAANLDPIPFRETDDAMDAPVPLFSGDKRLGWDPGWDRDAKMFYRQDLPLPFHLLSLTVQGDGGER